MVPLRVRRQVEAFHEGPRMTRTPIQVTTLWLAAALTAAVFVLDVVTPVGLVDWVFYLVPLLWVARALPPKWTVGFAALCTGLVALGGWLSPTGAPPTFALANRAAGVVVLWVIVLLLLRRQRAEAALRPREQQFRALIEHSLDAIELMDAHGCFLHALSPATTRLLGYDAGELHRRNAFELIHPDDAPAVKELFGQLLQRPGDHLVAEFRFRHKEGLWRWLEAVGTNLLAEPSVQAVVVNYRDVTARKQAEARDRAFASLGQRLSAARTALEAGRVIVAAADEMFGWDACTLEAIRETEDRQRNILMMDLINGLRTELPPTPGDQPITPLRREIMAHGARLIQNESGSHAPGTTPFGDTARPSASMLFAPIRYGVRVLGVLSIHSYSKGAYAAENLEAFQTLADFCGAALERIRAEEALRESERRFRELLEQVRLVGVILDHEGRVTFCNDYLLEVTGWRREEVIGRDWFAQFVPASCAEVREVFRGAIQRGELPAHFENPILTRTGEPRIIVWNNTLLRDAQGRIIGASGLGEDITERRRAETERARLLTVLESSLNEIYIFDARGLRFQYVNRGAQRNLGYSLEQLRTMTPVHLKPEFTEAAFREKIGPLLRRAQEKLVFNTEHRRADGSHYPVEVHLQLVTQGDQAVFLAVILDITERKRAEEAYRTLVERSLQGLAILQEGRIAFANQATATIFGGPLEELLALSPEEVMGRVHPEDRPSVSDRSRYRLAGQPVPSHYEFRILRKDGAVRWLTVSATLIKFKERPAIQAAFLDITEPKRAKEALARSEAQYRLVLENIDEIVYQVTLSDSDHFRGQVQFVSPRVEAIIGCKAEDFLADPSLWFSLLHPDDVAAVASQTQAMLAQRQGGTREYRLRHKTTGQYRWMEDRVTPQLDETGRVIGIFGVAHDVTARQRLQTNLRESQGRLELFFSQSLDGFFFMMLDEPVRWDDTVDKDKALDYVFTHQRITKVNDAMLAQYGLPREQCLGRTPQDFFAHDLASGRELWRRLFDAGRLHVESGERKMDSTPIAIEGDYICLYDAQGRITGHFGIQRDVTERKRAAEAYQTLVECSLQGLVILQDGRITFANPAAATIFGGTVADLTALSPEGVVGLVHPEDRPFVLQRQKDRLAGQPTPPHYEFRIVRKDGAVRWVDIFASLTHFQQGLAIQSAFIDITERKEAEQRLRQYTGELHALSRRLLAAQEAERRRMARELHDELGQELTGLKFNLEVASRLTGAELQDALHRTQGQLSHLMGCVRELSLELRPPMLDALGLLHALVWYCDRFEAQFHIRVDFQHCGLEGKRFAPEIETAAFRIVQESLTNVARHAGVSAVQVTAQVEPHRLGLAISDEGKGFDPEKTTLAGHTGGLSGMRERAALLGGNWAVESAPGAGTRLTVDLPLTVAAGAPPTG